jgi:amidase/aspartyl-tRNA(Asn)/glutamyl-tRNA(Gln) amidotransferase subunit A
MRFQSISGSEVEQLADRLRLSISDGEVESMVRRVNALGDIYADLEDPVDYSAEPSGDRFIRSPGPPGDDPYNAWLSRFELTRDGDGGSLSDVRIGIKDNTAVRGAPLTNGSRAFEDVIPGSNATVVDRLLEAGGTIVGKTNMDELAFGPTSETSAFGPTENPAAEGQVAGGSSAGSAAAVAAGEVEVAFGSDTGGSIRIPASYCGIVGLKPTYGLIPTHGVVPMAPSMDTVGPLTASVDLAARALDVLAATEDSTRFEASIDPDPANLSIGIAEPFFDEYVSEAVAASVRRTVDALADRGAEVRSVDITTLDRSREAWWGIAPVEFAAVYATDACGLFDRSVTEPTLASAMRRVRRASSRDLGRNAKAMLMLGAYLLETNGGAQYVRAKRLRRGLQTDVNRALTEVDVLVAPSTPTTALEIGGFERGVTPPVNWDTHPTNLTGHPSMSVPCDTDEGLPVGLQFIGNWHDEQSVIDAAAAVEAR